MTRKFSTKKKLTGSKLYKKWKDWTEGEYLIGQFVGTNIDQYKKTCWHLKIIETNFCDEDAEKFTEGKTIGLNSCGLLDKAMEDVQEGDIVEVRYQGTSIIEKGNFSGKEAHVVEVSIMQEDADTDEDLDL